MNEINDAQLNEYLDGTLDEEGRLTVEAQLAQSEAALARLAELDSLFTGLAAMSDVPPPATLEARVTAAVQAENNLITVPGWLRFLPFLQIVTAALLVMLFWTTLQTLWSNSRFFLADAWNSIQLPDLNLAAILNNWTTAVMENIEMASPEFQLATGQWAILLGFALVIWLFGNRLLFTNTNGGSHG